MIFSSPFEGPHRCPVPGVEYCYHHSKGFCGFPLLDSCLCPKCGQLNCSALLSRLTHRLTMNLEPWRHYLPLNCASDFNLYQTVCPFLKQFFTSFSEYHLTWEQKHSYNHNQMWIWHQHFVSIFSANSVTTLQKNVHRPGWSLKPTKPNAFEFHTAYHKVP